MSCLTIKFECLVVDGMIYGPQISNLQVWKFDSEQEASDFKNKNIDEIINFDKNIIYSYALDEMLNCIDINKCEDAVSTLIVCNLDDPMYTMAKVHNIGLKSFKNAMYIMEYRILTK